MVNTKIKLIMFFATKMEKLYKIIKIRPGWLWLRSWLKFRVKLKEVGRTTKPSRYDLNQSSQYVRIFGKPSSGHKTRKGQFSFQSQRRTMSKKVQTSVQLHLTHMLARLCSKSFKLGFSNTWTKNFQMYKMDLEKAEEPEIKFLTSIGS